ncbi:MAG: type II secretion system F family protein [Planctomycetia bacterium]|nr:type II secretion system F family protein [Planctomycetia bacterium]
MATPEFSVLDWNKKSVAPPLPPVHPEQTGLADTNDYVFGPLTPVLAAMLPDSETRQDESRKELHAAGYYQPHAPSNLAAIRYLCIIVPLVLLGLLLLVTPRALERTILISMLIVPAVGWALPRLVLKRRAAERTRRVEAGIPDMLDMLNMCVSQGMTLPVAFTRIARDLGETHPDLQTELKIVSEQAELGSLDQALGNFRRRIDVPEVHSFTTLLMQTERMGTSVATALSDYSENIREGLKQRAEEKGNRAAFTLLFPTVLCLMPAVFLILMGPAVLEFSNFIGRDDSTMQRARQIIQRTGQNNRQAP